MKSPGQLCSEEENRLWDDLRTDPNTLADALCDISQYPEAVKALMFIREGNDDLAAAVALRRALTPVLRAYVRQKADQFVNGTSRLFPVDELRVKGAI